jgi:hypothetical protein
MNRYVCFIELNHPVSPEACPTPNIISQLSCDLGGFFQRGIVPTPIETPKSKALSSHIIVGRHIVVGCTKPQLLLEHEFARDRSSDYPKPTSLQFDHSWNLGGFEERHRWDAWTALPHNQS